MNVIEKQGEIIRRFPGNRWKILAVSAKQVNKWQDFVPPIFTFHLFGTNPPLCMKRWGLHPPPVKGGGDEPSEDTNLGWPKWAAARPPPIIQYIGGKVQEFLVSKKTSFIEAESVIPAQMKGVVEDNQLGR